MAAQLAAMKVPEPFAADISARRGTAGRAWLRRLPDIVTGLCADWDLTPDGPPWWGYLAIVLPVTSPDGRPAVLKVSWPGPDQAPEAPTLAAWNGDGAVRLLRHDPDRWALLLERLDADRDLTGEPIDRAVQTIGCLLVRLHSAAVPREIPPLAAMATRWVHELPRLWPAADPPWPTRVCAEVVATCEELGNDSPTRLLHADLHFENVLAADREPWLAIDPKGLAGDPGFEAWSVLWNRVGEYAGPRDVGRRLDAWCEAAQIDRDRARAWARVRTVTDAIDRLAHATEHERDISVHRYLLAAIPS
jgi:streptomycin 6-kinase